MRTKLLSQNTTNEIVTLEEASEHSRITDSYDEIVVRGCLEAAHDLVQQWLNRKIYPSTIVGQMTDYKPRITLPFPPIKTVVSVIAEDCDGNDVTLVSGVDWKFDSIGETIRFIGNSSYLSGLSEFTFEYEAGYQDSDSVPDAVKHAIKMTFATLYENREDTVIGTQINTVPLTARRVLASHRIASHT